MLTVRLPILVTALTTFLGSRYIEGTVFDPHAKLNGDRPLAALLLETRVPGPSGSASTSNLPIDFVKLSKSLLPPDLHRNMSPIVAHVFINPNSLFELKARREAAILSGVKST